ESIKTAIDREGALIELTAKSLEKVEGTQVTLSINQGDSYGDVVTNLAKSLGLGIGLTIADDNDWMDGIFEEEVAFVGRPVDLFSAISKNKGFAWTVSGSTIWFASDLEIIPGQRIMRTYNTAAIEEALNARQRALEGKKTDKKANEPANEDVSEMEAGYADAASYLRSLFEEGVFGVSSGEVYLFGGVLSVRALPSDHVRVQSLLQQLKDTLNVTR
ncbi:MAG: hypothetical protein KDB07_05300, partial [Planctomycetes bacterium]|nr:hypothetical protein [Planctomycetota bacterium]